MKKFWGFFKKDSFLDILLIFLFILVLYPLFYAKQSSYLVDYGRETYVPWQMLNGEVLYKNIFNVYGPLGYQINALAYKFLGINLKTLYFLGFFNSFFISTFVYLISKIFLNRKISLCVAGVVISFCIYSVGVHNLIMPYSFNAVYALTGALISVYTMLLFIKEKNRRNLILSFLFAGFSFANKVEYLPYFGFLFILLPFVIENKKDWKSYLAPLGAFLAIPVVSFGILLFQGVSISDFLNAAILMKKLLSTPAVKFFYYEYGLYFNSYHFLSSFIIFGLLMKKYLLFIIVFYGLNWVNYRFVKAKLIKTSVNIFIFLFILMSLKYLNVGYQYSLAFYCWIGIFVLAVVTGFVLYEIFKLKKMPNYTISNNTKIYLFLCISSVLLSLKGLFSISQQAYGTLVIPLLIIPVYVFCADTIPDLIKKINKDVWQKVVVNITIINILIFLFLNIEMAINGNYNFVNTPRGKIFTRQCEGQDALINYIKNNTDKDSTLVVLPEGAIINFLSERKSHNYYYYLIPVNVQVFGEDRIINDFKQNPPDYFLVNNIPYDCYNVRGFSEFAPLITDYILKNYKKEFIMENGITFVLYKKK